MQEVETYLQSHSGDPGAFEVMGMGLCPQGRYEKIRGIFPESTGKR